MAKKVFKSKFFLDIEYEVLEEFWLDDDTYVMVCQDMEDVDGGIYHLEVEYHADEDRVTYTRVYEHENVDASLLVSVGFKKQMEEYILKQVGVVKGMLTKQKIAVELTLDIDPSVTMGELNEWLKEVAVGLTSTSANIRPIRVENLGWTK